MIDSRERSKGKSASQRNEMSGKKKRKLKKKRNHFEFGMLPVEMFNILKELELDDVRIGARRLIHQTPKSILVEINGLGHWFPKSNSRFGTHPSGLLFAVDTPEWLAKKKKLFLLKMNT